MPVARPPVSCPSTAWVALTVAGVLAAGGRLAAQGAPAALRGTVIDAVSDRPIAHATVSLLPPAADDEALARCSTSGRGAGARGAGATTWTDPSGRYVLPGVADGVYLLCVRAIGYSARALRVALDGAAGSQVHVGLPAVPRVLAPVRVRRVLSQTFAGAVRDGATEPARATLEHLRQQRDLTSDARALTLDDARAAAGLGELDVLRALQQLPGVAGRDDYTVAPWTRGAPSDQTAVLLDGVPLLAPYHGAGAVAAISVDAIGDATFLPGVASAALPAGAAGTLSLDSRRPTRPGLSVAGGASGVAASARVEGASGGGRVAGTVVARRSHLDLTNRWAARLGDGSRGLPYAFGDVAMRGDAAAGPWRIASSVLVTGDRLWAPVAGIVEGGTGRWGGTLAHLSVARELGTGTLAATVGTSSATVALRAVADARLEPAGVPDDTALYAVRERVFRPQPIDSRAAVHLATVRWDAAPDADGAARMAAGVEVAAWRSHFATGGPWPHTSRFIDSIATRSAATVATLWGERVWRPVPALTARTGARLELGTAARNAPAARLAPRVAVRYAPTPPFALSLAYGVTHQAAQTLAPPGAGRDAVATTDALWVVAGRSVPLLSTRTATLGAERWLGPSLLASTTLYRRDAVGVLLPDPRPGYLVDRPLAVEGRNRAIGLDGALRGFGTRWSATASYAIGRSRLDAYGLTFAAPSDRPWALRAGGTVYVLGREGAPRTVRVGLTGERAAGAPFTRYYGSVARCDASGDASRDAGGEASGGCRWAPPPRVGPPSEGRGRATSRLDASVDAQWRGRVLVAGAYVQLRNLTRAVNDAAYLATVGHCPADAQADGTCQPELQPASEEDTRLPALRGWLSVGVRLARGAGSGAGSRP